MNPKISVIIPVYNVEKYIVSCIESIINQSFKDFELILVDDGSTDKSIELAESELSESNVRHSIFHQENQGQATAREYGIQKSSGEWIVCIDSDDIVSPLFLESLYNISQSNTVDVALVSYINCLSDSKPIFTTNLDSVNIIDRKQTMRQFLDRSFAPILPTILIKKSLILEKSIKNIEGCKYSEDVCYMWQIFAAADKIAVSDMKLYGYIHHEGSTMTSSSYSRIITGYDAIKQTVNMPVMQTSQFGGITEIVPRWVMGALHSASRITDFKTFKAICSYFEYKTQLEELYKFQDARIRILARILSISPYCFWMIAKKI